VPDSFDPYAQWLEITEPTRPLDHYSLLGLSRRESNPESIAHAADMLMAKLRKIRPGGRLADWGRLLDQLGAAKACLLDPTSKATYDASLPADPPQQPAPQQPAVGGVFPSNMAVPPGMDTPQPQSDGQPASFFSGYSTPTLSSQSPAAAQSGADMDGLTQATQQPTAPTAPTGPTGMENQTAPDPMAPPGAYTAATPQPSPAPQAPGNPGATQGWSSAPTPLGVPTPAGLGSAGPATMQPQADAAQLPVGTPIPVGGMVPQAKAAKPRISTALSAMLLLAAACFAGYAFWQSRRPQPVVQSQTDNADDDSVTPVDSKTPDNPQPPETSQQPPEESPSTPQQPTDPPEQPETPVNPPVENPPSNPDPPTPANPPLPTQIDRQKQATFTKDVSQVRSAMSGRNVEAAKKYLDAARPNAQTPEEKAQVARLELMHDYIGQFWDGMSRSVATLEATQELAVMDTRVAVVESSAQHLIIRAAGRNRRYAIEDIPTVLVMAIVKECFPNEPGAKALIGTFLAVDPDGDRQRAQQYWEQAARGGIDVKALMPELSATPASAGGGGVPKPPAPTDQAEVQQAVNAVRAMFAGPYAEATTGAKKAALARQLIARARLDTDDEAKRFAMLREARDLAIASGDPGVAIEAIERMAEFFAIDAAGMKGAAMEAMSKTARGLSGQRGIAVATLKLIEETIAAKQWDEAARLADLAIQAARNSKSTTLMRQAAAAKQQIESLRKAGAKRA